MNNQITPPPVSMVMPPSANIAIAIINYTVLLLVALFMVREARRTRSALPIFCFLGGCTASLMEPIYDIVGLVWYPQYGPAPLFRFFNVSVPLWLLPAYGWFITGQGYFIYRKFQTGLAANQLWMFYGLFWLADLLLEVPGLTMHIYAYYGPQPFKIFGFPLWMAATNALMPLVLGATLISFQDTLKGWRVWIAAPLVPAVIGFCQIAPGWPIWLALNSGHGIVFTSAASIVTFGLSVLFAYLVVEKFCVPAKVSAALPASRLGVPAGGD
jgi:hypothetical protein